MAHNVEARVGVVGTGYIARGLIHSLSRCNEFAVSGVLTRRNSRDLGLEVNPNLITSSPDLLIKNSDVVVICTGDAIYGTDVALRAIDERKPIITMDSELQVTTGSYIAQRGFITESRGDQPGAIAALLEEVLGMGQNPRVYGNIKGFLNHYPTPEEMRYWAGKSGISLTQVTSFTDGTKLQIEQTLVANGLGAEILQRGLVGPKTDSLKEGALELAHLALLHQEVVSDYVLPRVGNPRVFIVADYEKELEGYMQYYKVRIDEGLALLERPFHLCNLEIPITLRRVIRDGEVLLNNGTDPKVSVLSVMKSDMKEGEIIDYGIGSFTVRGEAAKITDYPNHVPIGLLVKARVERKLEKDQVVTFSDVSLPESRALLAWKEIVSNRQLGIL